MAAFSSSNGVPPGFRFHPTDEELLLYYLKKKIGFEKFDLEVIHEVDLNKIEPWELQERCRIGSAPQNEWYFFSHKDRKYPTGSRTNRATMAGFWKATGRDKCIRTSYHKIGMRKTLVFYRGRAPHGQKTDWIMHEYRLEDADEVEGGTSLAIVIAGGRMGGVPRVQEEVLLQDRRRRGERKPERGGRRRPPRRVPAAGRPRPGKGSLGRISLHAPAPVSPTPRLLLLLLPDAAGRAGAARRLLAPRAGPGPPHQPPAGRRRPRIRLLRSAC